LRRVASTVALVALLIGVGHAFDGSMPVPVPGTSHIFAPGPRSLGLAGLAVNPSSIGDFDGVVALAYVKGRAVGGDGRRFVMANDMRVMSGSYLAADGSRHSGSFAFI
jgi:hypothetical protein